MNRPLTVPLLLLCLLATLLTPVAAQQSAEPKPPVGIPSKAKLFNGKWYLVYLEKTTWTKAKQKCERAGGQLAVVPDAPTQAFMAEFGKGLELWIGATDEKVEGLWVWVDGTEMKHKAWGRGQPVSGSRTENFLIIGGGGRWYDAPNDWACVGYICEWKAK